MFLITIQGAQATCFPDVCKTPVPPAPSPVPIPYPNMAMSALANPTSFKIMASGSPSLTKNSKITVSNGDTAGVAGGVVSGSVMGQCEPINASFKVKLQGKPALRHLDPVKSNKGNTFGSILKPSQVKVTAG